MTNFSSTLKELHLSSGRCLHYYSLNALETQCGRSLRSLPYSVKILLESLIRNQSHPAYTPEQVEGLLKWTPRAEADTAGEFPYLPSRVLLQDFTGVPCVVDLAALRAALARAGQDPAKIEPQIPVDLVIDHSVQIDEYRGASAFEHNLDKEFERNHERYVFLRWGQGAFKKLSVLPPGLGICHQVNMEYLASCVGCEQDAEGRDIAFPDTLVGTDSHTVMINAMGVMGWGVGGIEAEAAMLGQPIPILTPQVMGCKLSGVLPDTCTPTDIALKVTQVLREKGVVGSFIEYFGDGLDTMTVADRAPIANMAPEYGATMGFFPVDAATIDYLRMTGRDEAQIELVETYCRAQGLWRESAAPDPVYNEVVEINLSELEPSLAGPKRPQDRLLIREVASAFAESLTAPVGPSGFGLDPSRLNDRAFAGPYGNLKHGDVVIAAITSCTNTSNPTLMLAAGLVAKKAVEKGLKVPDYVKTSLAPGSRVVTAYLKNAGLLSSLETLGFRVVAYGCTTCIGNSGPLQPEIEEAIQAADLNTAAVLSGNRNFEGRVHPLTKTNYLASPPLVVAYALLGNVGKDLMRDPLGQDQQGKEVFLKDIWPTRAEIMALLTDANDPELYRTLYKNVVSSSPVWNKLPEVESSTFRFDDASTYIREPSFFDGFGPETTAPVDIKAAHALLNLGDFITTDHISPAGAIPFPSPAQKYLNEHGIEDADFNSFGSRRGNHEVMMRGTFANIRIRNLLVEREGGYTRHFPSGDEMSVFDAAMRYGTEKRELIVLAGKLYGAGSSRDWAAKGTFLLGVKAVIAESFERIHRSNLVEMGVLPLEFIEGQNAGTLGLDGTELFEIGGISEGLRPHKMLPVTATKSDGTVINFQGRCRIDSAIEVDYVLHGGILQYVLRDVMAQG
ncbi:aconitate hydratase AcnA [Kiritimatiellota bacterium B12222]|nr:aconitate hydratase AcnA [Kiritimatiellota bacterium B12222]